VRPLRKAYGVRMHGRASLGTDTHGLASRGRTDTAGRGAACAGPTSHVGPHLPPAAPYAAAGAGADLPQALAMLHALPPPLRGCLLEAARLCGRAAGGAQANLLSLHWAAQARPRACLRSGRALSWPPRLSHAPLPADALYAACRSSGPGRTQARRRLADDTALYVCPHCT